MSPQSQAIIVVAAGRGARAGEGLPKQYRSLAGETILCRTLRALYLGAPEARLLVVIHPDDLGLYEEAIAGLPGELRAVQTPQAFQFDLILRAHRSAAAAGRDDMTDDGAVAEWAGFRVHIFEGEAGNMKVTTPQDFVTAQTRLSAALTDVRTGQGFDVHAFTQGDHVCLGGVAIAHDRALLGHSDADVLMHAVTDAIYGALADGDIGAHFPPSDPKWKGAASEIFLRHAVARVRDRGGMIAHVDATVICEAPKVGPHRDRIRARLAEIMEIDIARVAVKATTSEELGFTGRREGIAAMALATVRLPE